MLKIVKLIDAVKATKHLTSDYSIAKIIGIPPSDMSSWRSGRRTPNQKIVFDLAGLTNEPPEYWLMLIESDRTKDENVAKMWEETAERIAS